MVWTATSLCCGTMAVPPTADALPDVPHGELVVRAGIGSPEPPRIRMISSRHSKLDESAAPFMDRPPTLLVQCVVRTRHPVSSRVRMMCDHDALISCAWLLAAELERARPDSLTMAPGSSRWPRSGCPGIRRTAFQDKCEPNHEVPMSKLFAHGSVSGGRVARAFGDRDPDRTGAAQS